MASTPPSLPLPADLCVGGRRRERISEGKRERERDGGRFCSTSLAILLSSEAAFFDRRRRGRSERSEGRGGGIDVRACSLEHTYYKQAG